MSEQKDVITSYNNLSFSDRIVFYTTISNDIAISDDTQSFLIETRLDGEGSCIYCSVPGSQDMGKISRADHPCLSLHESDARQIMQEGRVGYHDTDRKP